MQRRTLKLGLRTASYRAAGPGVAAEDAGVVAADAPIRRIGPIAVVTAGLGLSSRFYSESFDAFAAAGITLIVPDLPGWGETPGPASGLGPRATASFLTDFADATGIRSATWIGHSLGAQAVVELAARQPARASALVLAGPTGAPERFRLLRQLTGLAIEAKRTSLDVIGAVAREYASTSPVRYIGTWLRHARHDLTALLPQVHCPVLVIAGDRDPVARNDFIDLLGRRLPAATVVRVPDGTHALPRGCADQFNGAVIDFIRQASATG